MSIRLVRIFVEIPGTVRDERKGLVLGIMVFFETVFIGFGLRAAGLFGAVAKSKNPRVRVGNSQQISQLCEK